MRRLEVPRAALVLALVFGTFGLRPAFADGDIGKVNHVIVVMQSSHSFDNYFGALAYAPGSPYHNGNGACDPADHSCVDGLTCALDGMGNFDCSNANTDLDGITISSFHQSQTCGAPALDSSWFYTHRELNFLHPNLSLTPFNDGFLRVNDLIRWAGIGDPSTPSGQAMAFYNQQELPFYYDLAEKFAIADRYFASVPGPAFPNRSYLLAATSFGHVGANESLPPLQAEGWWRERLWAKTWLMEFTKLFLLLADLPRQGFHAVSGWASVKRRGGMFLDVSCSRLRQVHERYY